MAFRTQVSFLSVVGLELLFPLLGIGNTPAPMAPKDYTSPKEELLIATHLCHHIRLSHFCLTTMYILFVMHS